MTTYCVSLSDFIIKLGFDKVETLLKEVDVSELLQI